LNFPNRLKPEKSLARRRVDQYRSEAYRLGLMSTLRFAALVRAIEIATNATARRAHLKAWNDAGNAVRIWPSGAMRTPKLAAFFCRPASRNQRWVLNQAVVALL
jgi:hypothetical protein